MNHYFAGKHKLILLLALGVMLSLMLTACETTPTAEVIDTSCSAFKTISWHNSDTPQTINEIRKHNAAWRALCQRT